MARSILDKNSSASVWSQIARNGSCFRLALSDLLRGNPAPNRSAAQQSGLLALISCSRRPGSHRQSSGADICRRGCAIVLANPAAGQHSPILGNHEAKYGDRDMPRSNPSPGLGSRRSPDAPRVRIGFVRVAINWHLANRFAGFSPPRGAPGNPATPRSAA